MNKTVLAVGGSILALVVIIALALFGTGVGVYNQCVAMEKGIEKQYADNQNVYDNYVKKVMETAQIPQKYAQDVKEVYMAAISGRYGAEGSKAVFQWIQEHNPTIDASIYKQVQQVIETGRNEFQSNQTSLLERKRIYETYTATFPNNMFVKMLGFPKIDMAKYDIVTSDSTQKAFETKKAEPLKVF